MFKNKKYALTFDVDWAPDYAILHCLDLLDLFKKKATFFTTHHTELNVEIYSRGHELGIHPNFLGGANSNEDFSNIIEKCMSYAPDAWCMRTHGLYQSSSLLYSVFKNFSQLKLDVSLLMHRSPYSHKCLWEYGEVTFERLMYNWEDDLEFKNQRFGPKEKCFFGDITVFDFHPIHVFLNSSDGSEYTHLKQQTSDKTLNKVLHNDAIKFKNEKEGVETFLKRVLHTKAETIMLDDI